MSKQIRIILALCGVLFFVKMGGEGTLSIEPPPLLSKPLRTPILTREIFVMFADKSSGGAQCVGYICYGLLNSEQCFENYADNKRLDDDEYVQLPEAR